MLVVPVESCPVTEHHSEQPGCLCFTPFPPPQLNSPSSQILFVWAVSSSPLWVFAGLATVSGCLVPGAQHRTQHSRCLSQGLSQGESCLLTCWQPSSWCSSSQGLIFAKYQLVKDKWRNNFFLFFVSVPTEIPNSTVWSWKCDHQYADPLVGAIPLPTLFGAWMTLDLDFWRKCLLHLNVKVHF